MKWLPRRCFNTATVLTWDCRSCSHSICARCILDIRAVSLSLLLTNNAVPIDTVSACRCIMGRRWLLFPAVSCVTSRVNDRELGHITALCFYSRPIYHKTSEYNVWLLETDLYVTLKQNEELVLIPPYCVPHPFSVFFEGKIWWKWCKLCWVIKLCFRSFCPM